MVNWLGIEAGLTLRSLNLTYDEPKTIFDALREVFRPIGNRMMSRFKFKSLKQKQGATVDAHIAELKVLIKECGYEENMQNILLKDQFIFGVTIREIQEHLLNEIGDDHDLNQCLMEARKIESRIAQRKLLGLMFLFSMIVLVTKEAGLRKNSNPKTKGLSPDLSLELEIASIVIPIISIENALHMAKLAKVVVGKIILLKSAGQKARAGAIQVREAKSNLNTERSM